MMSMILLFPTLSCFSEGEHGWRLCHSCIGWIFIDWFVMTWWGISPFFLSTMLLLFHIVVQWMLIFHFCAVLILVRESLPLGSFICVVYFLHFLCSSIRLVCILLNLPFGITLMACITPCICFPILDKILVIIIYEIWHFTIGSFKSFTHYFIGVSI